MIKFLGIFAAITLPLWNIPLIQKISRRKSSKDFSLWWTFGVWTMFLLMFPSALVSQDPVFKIFSIMNILIFTGVVIQVVRYR